MKTGTAPVYGNAGWLAGGGLIGEKPVYALANGLYMGTVIDNFLKTGNLLNPENVQETAMCLNPAKLMYEAPVVPADGSSFERRRSEKERRRAAWNANAISAGPTVT